MDPQKYETLRNQTLLFFIEKLISEDKKRTLHDLSCQFGCRGFTREMRQIAGGSQSGLKKFLSDYPSIFSIENDLVMYKDTSYVEKIVDDIGKEAVGYFREKMIQYGIGVWVPVRSLLGHRSQAPSEIRHISGQHIDEFVNFLKSHPQTFIIKDDAVMLKEFIKENSKNESNFDKSKITKLVEFYTNILEQRGPMLVEQLFHLSYVFEDGFNSLADLKSFFQIHSQCFLIHNSMVNLTDHYKVGLEHIKSSTKALKSSEINVTLKPIKETIKLNHTPSTKTLQAEESSLKSRVSSILLKTLSENFDKNKSTICNKNFEDLMQDEESLKNHLVSKTEIVSNLRKGRSIVEKILNCKLIGVDCEGVCLGDEIGGRITMVQLAVDSDIFIFDVLTQPGLIDELRRVLEGEEVVKVMHDCRNDSGNLYKEFGIKLNNVFDTQAAYTVLSKDAKIKNISLNGLCEFYKLGVCNPFKEKIKATYRHDQRYWSRRPLTKQMIAYASCDVLCLVRLYKEMEILEQEDKVLLKELIQEQIDCLINPEEIRQKRRNRKNEQDLKSLLVKIEGSLESECAIVLSNREMRLLKHLELSELAKEKLKSSVKVAKKLEKMENINKSEESSSSEFTSLEYNNEVLQDKFHSIDALIDGIITESIVFDKNFVDVGVQTNSTGDIVVMGVWSEE